MRHLSIEPPKHFEELLKEADEAKEAKLRFGAKLLIISELAEQYHREKRLSLNAYTGKRERLE
jgi:hypothetical protein